jgi:FkbM family methyltransferase
MVSTRGIKVSYAQNREDIILAVLLNGVKKGFYIDVGANDPVLDSVTKYFYDRGWRGINIEPNPALMQAIKAARTGDINLQVAVGSGRAKAEFREYHAGKHGLSTLSSEMKLEHGKEKLKFKEYEVEVRTLKDILSEHAKNRPVDFLKIDVEGLEYEVIAGNDWQKYRPKIVVAEISHLIKDWRPLLTTAGYEKVFFDGLNEYYAAREYASRVDFGAYPQIALEDRPLSWHEKKTQDDLTKTVRELKREHNRRLKYQAMLKNIYARPFRFAAARVYHYYIKRDQTKEFKD